MLLSFVLTQTRRNDIRVKFVAIRDHQSNGIVWLDIAHTFCQTSHAPYPLHKVANSAANSQHLRCLPSVMVLRLLNSTLRSPSIIVADTYHRLRRSQGSQGFLLYLPYAYSQPSSRIILGSSVGNFRFIRTALCSYLSFRTRHPT